MHDGMVTTANTGVELHYRDWGGYGPPLVLVHGLASTLRIWDFVAPVLAEKYRVVAYDQRGHALSGKPGDGYDLTTMLADLVGLLEALHIEKPVVVGHSWGANLALAYAAAYPYACSALVLVDGGVYDFQDTPGTTWEGVRRDLAPPDLSAFKLTDMVSRMHRGALSHLPVSFLEEYARSMMDVQPDGTIRARLTRDRHLDILHIIYSMRSADLLSKVKCPILAIQAVDGEPADSRGADFLRRKKQGVERVERLVHGAGIIWMEDTIHDIPLQRPERLANEITAFLAVKGL
ncbi:MAG: alpha/beta hydrolase [Chloroflexota bacterium]